MSDRVVQLPDRTLLRNRRVGLILGLIALLYLAAVILFIIVY